MEAYACVSMCVLTLSCTLGDSLLGVSLTEGEGSCRVSMAMQWPMQKGKYAMVLSNSLIPSLTLFTLQAAEKSRQTVSTSDLETDCGFHGLSTQDTQAGVQGARGVLR